MNNFLPKFVAEYALHSKCNSYLPSGSGLGGNVDNLARLLTMPHEKSSRVSDLLITESAFIWNPRFLKSDPLKIREVVDSKLESIPEQAFQSEKLLLTNLDEYLKLPEGSSKLNELFSDDDLRRETPYILPNLDQMFLFMFYAKNIAILADAKTEIPCENNIQGLDQTLSYFARIAKKCHAVFALYSLRTQVTINRLIKHHMDEHLKFISVVDKVNRVFKN